LKYYELSQSRDQVADFLVNTYRSTRNGSSFVAS